MDLSSKTPGPMILLVLLVTLVGGVALSLPRGNAAYASGAASPAPQQRPTVVPPREPLTPTPQPLLDPGLLCLQLIAQQETQSSGSVVSYDVVMRNLSHTVRALRPVVSVPAGLRQRLEVVNLPVGAWVQEAQQDAMTVALPSLAPQKAFTMTLRLPRFGLGEIMPTRVGVDWANRQALVPTTRSNQVLMTQTDVRGPVAGGELTVRRSPEGLILVGAGFTSYERVGVWYDSPGRQTVALSDAVADSEGMIQMALPARALPEPAGDIVAYGTCSQQWLVGRVTP